MDDSNNNSVEIEANSTDKELAQTAAKKVASTKLGPTGDALVEAASRTKAGDEILNKGGAAIGKLRKKIMISFILFLTPLFLMTFVLFITVFYILGFITSDGSSSNNSNICAGVADGEVSALYDSSFTKEQFVSIVNSYTVPNGSHNSHSYSWGYETFFKPNASNFYDICTKYGMDPRFIFSIGIHESAYGTSNIALKKGNFFGWAAYDSSPYDSAKSFQDMSEGIETVAKGLSTGYVIESGSQYKAIKNRGLDPRTVQGIGSSYASDNEWANSVVKYMQKIFGLTTTTSACNGNFQALEKYNYNHEGLKVLSSPLSSTQVKALDQYIVSEVDKAGYGTGAGVAAAGQALVYGLEQYGVYLDYKYGARNHTVGVDPYWHGKRTMDCSSFVTWAIKNGCNPSFQARTTAIGSFNSSTFGKHIPISEAKPGDIMITNAKGHIRLVIKNNGDGTVIVAEEAGGKGLIFAKRDANERRGYHFQDMSEYYSKNCKTSR